MEALDDYEGPELGGLTQGQRISPGIACRHPDHTVQKEFIERSEKILARMEAGRIAETELLAEGRARLVRTRQQLLPSETLQA